jgi:hypothetical protein
MFLRYFRTAWNDHFPATTTTNLNKQTHTSRPAPSGSNLYVSNCLFKSITSENSGGALYLTSISYFLVESTSFFTCKVNSGSGGAIYFSNNGGQSVLHAVCGYDCCSSPYYQFAYIGASNVASSKNSFNYSSIARCGYEVSNADQTLRLLNGKIYCPSVNISMNKCAVYPCICSDPLSDSNSVTCLFSYSSFTNNTATRNTCIVLCTSGAKYDIKSCNILRNTQISSSEGTIRSHGNAVIVDSCILENKATNIFYSASSSCTITLSNCTVDSTSNNRNLIIQNTVTKSFIHGFYHMSTQNCHSEYDAVGTLKPIMHTTSPSKNQIQCFTIGKFFYQPKLKDVISLTSVFIFNFIHPYAFSYHLF